MIRLSVQNKNYSKFFCRTVFIELKLLYLYPLPSWNAVTVFYILIEHHNIRLNATFEVYIENGTRVMVDFVKITYRVPRQKNEALFNNVYKQLFLILMFSIAFHIIFLSVSTGNMQLSYVYQLNVLHLLFYCDGNTYHGARSDSSYVAY